VEVVKKSHNILTEYHISERNISAFNLHFKNKTEINTRAYQT